MVVFFIQLILIFIGLGIVASIIQVVFGKRLVLFEGSIFSDKLTHISGLSIPEGVRVHVVIYVDRVVFVYGDNMQFNLERSRITDVRTMTEEEITTYREPNIPGLVIGGLLRGWVGAAIGGRPRTKTSTSKSHFLVFMYTKDDSLEMITFELDMKIQGWSFTVHFPKGSLEQTTIEL